jgi:hypothetical protein
MEGAAVVSIGMEEELENHIRKLDQRSTFHAVLAEKYERLSSLSDVCLISSSIFLCVVGFSDNTFYDYFKINPITAKIWLGLFSLFTTIFGVLAWKYDWKSKSDSHKRDLNLLTNLKHEGIRLIRSKTRSDDQISDICGRIIAVQESVAHIPDSQFIKLKSLHLRKVSLSKFLDENHHRPLVCNRIIFQFGWIFKRHHLLESQSKSSKTVRNLSAPSFVHPPEDQKS